jgi:hypothetical protein
MSNHVIQYSYRCGLGINLHTLCVNQEFVCGERSVLVGVPLGHAVPKGRDPSHDDNFAACVFHFPSVNQVLSVVSHTSLLYSEVKKTTEI